MIRILHVTTGLGVGGAENFLCRLINALRAPSFEHVVISLSPPGPLSALLQASGVRVIDLGIRPNRPNPFMLVRFRHEVRSFKPVLVQGWMYHGNLASWLACQLVSPRPALAWNVRQTLYGLSHEKRLTRLAIRANRRLSRAPAILIYNSCMSRTQHERYGFHAEHSRVVPNGFDLANWHPAAPGERARIRQRLGIPEDVPVVGHVARLHPMKDHPRFLRTAVRLAERYPGLHLLLVGTGVTSDQPLWRGLVPGEMGSRFHFLGERSDVASLMRAVDALCVSSAWGEAFPNVLGEAMASGVPCVATDVGDSAAILGDTGVVVTPGDDAALYRGVCQIIDAGAETRRELGLAARARVQAHYSLGAAVAKYTDLYTSLTA